MESFLNNIDLFYMIVFCVITFIGFGVVVFIISHSLYSIVNGKDAGKIFNIIKEEL